MEARTARSAVSENRVDAAAAGPSTDVRAFVKVLRGEPVVTEEQVREFVDAISTPQYGARAAAGPSTDVRAFVKALRGEPVITEEQVRQFVDAISTVHEGTYDPAKHPRGGYPQHPGEWSPAGGSGSGSGAPPSQVALTTPATARDSGGKPFRLASASSKDHAIGQAAAKGDLATLKDLINSGGLSAGERKAAQAAINRLTDTAQNIISKELEGRVMREFPREMLKMKLKDIMDLAKGIGPLAGKAKKALKLLRDNRFKK